MPRFMFDPNRVNYNIQRKGKEYNLRVLQRAQSIFSTLLDLLPSNWISGVEGPSYTLELKAIAVELAKIELALEDVNRDISFETTRSEFLYSIVGYLVFINGRMGSCSGMTSGSPGAPAPGLLGCSMRSSQRRWRVRCEAVGSP